MTALRVIANVLFTCFQRVPVQPKIMFQVTEKSLQSDIEECTLTHVIQSICSKWNEIVLRSWGTEPQSEYTITVTDIEPGEVGEINQWRSALSFHFIDFSSWLWLSQRKLPKIGRARNGLQGNLKLRLKMAATPTPLSAIETSKELLNLKLWHTTFISFIYKWTPKRASRFGSFHIFKWYFSWFSFITPPLSEPVHSSFVNLNFWAHAVKNHQPGFYLFFFSFGWGTVHSHIHSSCWKQKQYRHMAFWW